MLTKPVEKTNYV